MNCQKNASEPQATPLLFVTIFAKTTLAGISADRLPHVVATEKKAAPSSKALRPAVFRQSCNHQFPAPASKKNAALPISSLLVAQSHTPCNRCVRFAATVPSGHATLATKRTLLLTWAGPPPPGSHQLCLAHSLYHLVGEQQEQDYGHCQSPRAKQPPPRQLEARLRGRVADRARGRASRYGRGERQRRTRGLGQDQAVLALSPPVCAARGCPPPRRRGYSFAARLGTRARPCSLTTTEAITAACTKMATAAAAVAD